MKSNELLTELFYCPNLPYIGMKCQKCFEEMGFILSHGIVLDANDPVFIESVRLLKDKYNRHECSRLQNDTDWCKSVLQEI